MTTRSRELIENAVGPTPWYWKTFPAVKGKSGQDFAWIYHGNEGELAYLVTLQSAAEPDKPRLALNTYCRPFNIAQDFLGIWCPEPNSLRLLCFDPDELKTFSFVDIVGWFKNSNERVYAATEPLAEFELSSSLPEGVHKLDIPPEFRSVDELLLISSHAARTGEDPGCAIYVLYPHAGLVEVLPQKWFTASKYEVGRQWIARVARDPESHRILGEGVRMGDFELVENGQEIARWIDDGS